MAEQVHELYLLRRKQVESRTGLRRSTIYARIAEGTFPPPVSLGARAVGWPSDLIDRWIAERIADGRRATA